MFYVDLEEDVESPGFEPVMKSLDENTDYLKVLGSY
jgi:prephenate dehydratase